MARARGPRCGAPTGSAGRLPPPADNGDEWLSQPVVSLKTDLGQAGGSTGSLSQRPSLSLIVSLRSLLHKVRRSGGFDVSLNLIKLT